MTICSTKGEKNGNCQASPPDGETHRAEDGTIGGTRSIAPSMSMPSAAARGQRRRPAPGREAWIRRAGAGPGGTPEGRHRRESRRAGNAGSACFRGEASDLSRRFSGALHWRRFPPLPSCAPPPRRENGLNGFRPLTVSTGAEAPRIPPLAGRESQERTAASGAWSPFPSREKHHGPAACPPSREKHHGPGTCPPFAGGASGDAGCGTLMASALPW